MIEWRTVIFIRHGKSNWNAAEGSTMSKAIAAGQGFWEYYKHKKLRQNNVKKQKTDNVDIMDAPLSREGIMEALNLCTYLRQYTTNKELTNYNQLFEKTREEINSIIPLLTNTTNHDDDESRKDINSKLQQLLKRLDEFKIESLIAQHPPQDDDNLRLPQPVPEITKNNNQVNPNTIDPKVFTLTSINDEVQNKPLTNFTEETKENNNIQNEEINVNVNDNDNNTKTQSRSPSAKTNGINTPNLESIDVMNNNNKRKGSNANDSDMDWSATTGNIPSNLPSPSLPSATQSFDGSLNDEFSTTNGGTDYQRGSISKNNNNKRYMQQIAEPHIPMNAKYVVNLLNGNEQKCGIVVSNLRRAMSTACICLRDRLQRRPYEKIQILGCLQEMGMNSDTRPLLVSKDNKPTLSKKEKTSPLLKGVNMEQLYEERLSTKYYKGDASDKSGEQRLQEFALWLFAQRKYLHVIAIGHSHWFQNFFKAYLPDISDEELPANVRTAKIRNCGVVAFRIQKRYVASKSKRHGRHISFEIAPQSITVLSFGFNQTPTTTREEKLKKQELKQQQQEQKQKENSTSSNKENNGYLSAEQEAESEEDVKENDNDNDNDNDNNNKNKDSPQSTSINLVQSSSTIATSQTPGILASIPDDGQQINNYDTNFTDFLDLNIKDDDKQNGDNSNRLRIPDKSPPPVPPSSSSSSSSNSNNSSNNNNKCMLKFHCL